ncbi:hypothetical protein PEDI_45560 [Persicobacter diffluens]|uniref:HTH araC/xylS-type domain-containing protein n=1 Tax=Persicobacter diffluens TaxID=981 RepID=A0AAN4W1F8_9BACT|nr:hypothetical protein PEDI_45560 [Persicobacter diffluens]
MLVLKFFNLHWLEEAHRQVKYSGKNLVEIGTDLGYLIQAHFSNAFKKQFGLSPKAFREKG